MSEDSYNIKLLSRLSDLLRKTGDCILNGESILSLTTSSLILLNEGFNEIRQDDLTTSFEVVSANIPRLEFLHNLEFIYDIVQKTCKLKIVHCGSTLRSPVNIACFRNLQELELKKIPVHFLEGLCKLKGRLHKIIATKCIINLHDLFETCGGDQCVPSIWPGLHTVILRSNMIEELDSCLRLVPDVTHMDLSHNSLKNADNCLEYLTELTSINVGYNNLVVAPTFALSCRSSLTTLILRNNYLEHLEGIGLLVGLRVLDLANNCICDHLYLFPLYRLNRLTELLLDGNPLTFHKDHRILTVKNLHPQAVKQLKLDGKPLNKKEQLNISLPGTLPTKPDRHLLINEDTFDGYSSLEQSFSSSHAGGFHSLPSSSAYDDTDNGNIAISRKSKGKGKGRGKKSKGQPRAAQIADMDGESSQAEGNTSTEEKFSSFKDDQQHSQMKQEVEQMRKQLGPNWLSTLAVKTKDNFTDRKTNLEDGADNCSFTSFNADESSFKSLDVQPNEDDLYLNDTSSVQNVDKPSKPSDAPIIKEHKLVDKKITGVNSKKKSENKTKRSQKTPSPEENNIYVQRQKSTSDDRKDYGAESDPFIVTVPGESEEYIMTVAERYILLKNINGQMMETLDIAALQNGEVSADGDAFLLTLQFDTLRKDKRDRTFVMEDEVNAQNLYEILSPVIENRKLINQLKDQLQCLKCGNEFSKTEALRHVITDNQASSQEKGDLSEGLSCPSCLSNMVIELHPEDVAKAKGLGGSWTTPVGSFNVTSCQQQPPLATSSTYTTPRQPTVATKRGPYQESVDRDRTSNVSDDTGEPSSFMSCRTSTSTSFKSTDETVVNRKSDKSVDNNSQSFNNVVRPLQFDQRTTSGLLLSNVEKDNVKTHISSNNLTLSNNELGFTKPGVNAMSKRNSAATTNCDSDIEILKPASTASDIQVLNEESSNSDIEILKRNSNNSDIQVITRKSTDSDIQVLTRESTNSDIQVLSRESSTNESQLAAHQANLKAEQQSSTRNDGKVMDSAVSGSSNRIRPNTTKQNVSQSGSDLLILSNTLMKGSAATNSNTLGKKSNSECSNLNAFSSAKRLVLRRLSSDIEVIGEAQEVRQLSPQNEEDDEQFVQCLSSQGDGALSVSSDEQKLDQLSPCGSLTTKTVSSMVDHMYKSVYEAHNDDTVASTPTVVGSTGATNSGFAVMEANVESVSDECVQLSEDNGVEKDSLVLGTCEIGSEPAHEEKPGIVYNFADFSQVDHRLKLHFMMHLFEDDEFELLLKCGIVQLSCAEEFPGLLVISSHKVYIVKISNEDSESPMENWLSEVYTGSLADIQYIDIGINYQMFRIEFDARARSFLFLIRDEDRCKQFIAQFTKCIQTVMVSAHSKLQGISKNSAATHADLQQIKDTVLYHGSEDGDCDPSDFDESGLRVMLGYLRTGELNVEGEESLSAVTLLLTASHVCVARENLAALPCLCDSDHPEPPSDKSLRYYYQDRHQLTDITALDLYRDIPQEVTICFLDESTNEESTWCIVMETKEALMSLVKAVKVPWEATFGVELEIRMIDTVV